MRPDLTLLICAALGLASAAQAACIDRTTFEAEGLTVVYSEGANETHRLDANRNVVITHAQPFGDVDRYRLAKGLYYVEQGRLVQGGAYLHNYSVRYRDAEADLPIPRPDSNWDMNSRLTFTGGDNVSQTETYSADAPFSLTLPGCSYTAFRVTATTRAAGDIDILTSLYLPDLGTSFAIELNGSPWRWPLGLLPAEPAN